MSQIKNKADNIKLDVIINMFIFTAADFFLRQEADNFIKQLCFIKDHTNCVYNHTTI